MTKRDLEIENMHLRNALRPFAKAATSLPDDHADGLHLMHSDAALTLCGADLKRAASRLSE